MPEYTSICVNMAKSVCLNFVLHAPIVIPCLLKSVVAYFNNVYSFKKREVTILFYCRDFKFLQARFQVYCFLWVSRAGSSESGYIIVETKVSQQQN